MLLGLAVKEKHRCNAVLSRCTGHHHLISIDLSLEQEEWISFGLRRPCTRRRLSLQVVKFTGVPKLGDPFPSIPQALS